MFHVFVSVSVGHWFLGSGQVGPSNLHLMISKLFSIDVLLMVSVLAW